MSDLPEYMSAPLSVVLRRKRDEIAREFPYQPANDSSVPDDEMLLAEALARFERRLEFDLSDDVGIAVVPELEPEGEAPLYGCRWAAEAGAYDTDDLGDPAFDLGLEANADRFSEIEDYYAAGAALAIIVAEGSEP